jgi:hypothetical protein
VKKIKNTIDRNDFMELTPITLILSVSYHTLFHASNISYISLAFIIRTQQWQLWTVCDAWLHIVLFIYPGE